MTVLSRSKPPGRRRITATPGLVPLPARMRATRVCIAHSCPGVHHPPPPREPISSLRPRSGHTANPSQAKHSEFKHLHLLSGRCALAAPDSYARIRIQPPLPAPRTTPTRLRLPSTPSRGLSSRYILTPPFRSTDGSPSLTFRPPRFPSSLHSCAPSHIHLLLSSSQRPA